jgi:hypothetical protein
MTPRYLVSLVQATFSLKIFLVGSLKLIEIIFKNSVRTAKKTLHFTIIKINWLTLFKEIIAVYSHNHTKLVNTT